MYSYHLACICVYCEAKLSKKMLQARLTIQRIYLFIGYDLPFLEKVSKKLNMMYVAKTKNWS